MNSVFADVSVSVAYQNGAVRIDLGNLRKKNGENESSVEPHSTLVMPIHGVLNMMNSLVDLVDQMEKAGVIKKTEEKQE